MHPKDLSISDFNYHLPDERVAKYPLAERDQSKLLVYKSGKMDTMVYADLAGNLPPGSLLVFNNTKVVEARLLFQKSTGAIIEVFCLEPDSRYPDITTAMLKRGKVYYRALIGGASKWKQGMILEKRVHAEGGEIILHASIAERLSDCFVVELTWQPLALSFAEILHAFGQIPLPPYLHRQADESDKTRYQTVYAKHDGSVAAPTAGLHFTDSVLASLVAKGVDKTFVTLHVGAGTFKPVSAQQMKEHQMHGEYIDVSIGSIDQLIAHLAQPIVPVGTTSLRTIESLYWIGVKLINDPSLTAANLDITQWEAYEKPSTFSAKEALQAILQWMNDNQTERLITKTHILIAPGYQLRIAGAIITNFHQPHSTLLLLIAAIVGDEWKRIYQYALDHDFRFLSYGDGCLLWPNSA